MSKISPEAFSVLSRIKRYGLDSWLPGKLVISSLADTTFSRANAKIIADLISRGYLVMDDAGAISTGLAGDHELRSHPNTIHETRVKIGDKRFQIITDDWAIESDATRVRGVILSGLLHVSESHPERLALIHRKTTAGVEDDVLSGIVISALSLVTAHYSDGFAEHAHRVGVRAYGSWSPSAVLEAIA